MKNNWQKVKLGSCLIGRPEYGINAPAVDFCLSLPAYLRITDISEEGKFLTNKKVSVDDPESKRYILDEGDVVFARTGASVGKTYIHKDENGKLVFAGFLIRVRTNREKLLPEFLNFYTHTERYYKLVKEISPRSGQPGINSSEYSEILFLLPPIEEQGRIVRVLECWDGYLEKLNRKIEVKKSIKKGLMQTLLTGEKRLAGFSDKWQVVKLGDVSKMRSGGTPKSTVPEFYDGGIPWVSISDMTKCGKVLYSTERTLSKKGMENSAAFLYPKGTILYAMYASIGECVIAGIETTSSQAILGIQPKIERLDGIFLYFYLVMIKEKIKLQGQQGTQSNLNAGMVRDFILNLPKLEEQKAIAEILAKADEEIKALEKKKEIIEVQKKFLLNNLVTGNILTPENI
jgi:type I restriction enzyme, S subunit